MKKRIFAASMASVMALSSVSVVAFADETKADFGETVTKAELKEAIKQYDETLKNIDSYGSVQALRFQEAYDHAKYVTTDAKTGDTEATAAYQMLKAVASKLVQHTNEELKELVEDLKPKYEENNILNEEIMDYIYDEDGFVKFKSAFEDAEAILDVKDLMMTTDAYILLDEANNALVEKDKVQKSEYRKTFREYEAMLKAFGEKETWRRGKVYVNPVTGNADDNNIYLTSAEYVTWGELQNVVDGSSDTAVVGKVNPVVNKAAGEDTMLNSSNTYRWIAVGTSGTTTTTVKEYFYEQSEVFDSYKAATETTDDTIKGAYDAAKEAIAVFKSWKAIDDDSTRKAQAHSTLNDFRTQLANDFEQTLIKSLEVNDGTVDGLGFASTAGGSVDTAALEYKDGKLVGVAGAGKAGCYLRIDSGTNLIQLDETLGNTGYASAVYEPKAITGRKSYTVKIAEGVDYMKYIPVRAGNVVATSGKGIDTDTTTTLKKVGRVGAALELLEAYDFAVSDSPANKADGYWENLFGKKDNVVAKKVVDDVADLDENTTVTKPTSSAVREYTFINRYLKYALDDLYPKQSEPCKHTRKDVEEKVAEAYDLIEKTGDANIFAEYNAALAAARHDAVEWLRETYKNKNYKDNVANEVDASTSTVTKVIGQYSHAELDKVKNASGDKVYPYGANATEVYHTLSDKLGDLDGNPSTIEPYGFGAYDVLQTWVNNYPESYAEIAKRIAVVNGDIEDGLYGEKVKAAVDNVAYALSVLKEVTLEGNEAFTDERAFNGYNRLYKGVNPTTDEKNLKDALDALDEAIKAGETGDVVLGDVDGDGQPTAKDAKLVLQYAAGQIELTAAQIKAADFDGDGVPTAKDAKAILMAAAGMTE